jgi:hypothetical protein
MTRLWHCPILRAVTAESASRPISEQAREREGTAEAHAARQGRSGAARGEFCFVGFLDGPFGAVIEVPTRFSRRQAVRRTQQ